MSYSRYEHQEHMREEKSDDDYYVTHTTSGVPLDKLVHVTNIPYYEGGFAAVNWCQLTNEFLICEPGHQDWVIPRTEETLRAFARMLAFNPKEWGCSRCGCSAEMNADERICWCDTCQKEGCTTPSKLVEYVDIVPRVKSQYFKKRELPPLPLLPPLPPSFGSLQRFMTLGDLGQPVNPIGVIMEDDERDKWFRNPVDRSNMFKGS